MKIPTLFFLIVMWLSPNASLAQDCPPTNCCQLSPTNFLRLNCEDCTERGGTNLGFNTQRCDAAPPPMPVELLYFDAQIQNKYIHLQWATPNEINIDYFAIEYSRDGNGFKEIGQVKGKGNTTEKANYSFLHHKPNLGDNYYRLRQVDYDGSIEYSEVIVRSYSKNKDVGIHPNIVKKELNLHFYTTTPKDKRVIIYDLYGRPIDDCIFPGQATRKSINIEDLPSGKYIMHVHVNNNIKTLRFIKI